MIIRNNKHLVLWAIVTIITLIASVNNATLVFDDLYLVEFFKKLLEEHGFLYTAQYLFFSIDLGQSEFRLYGISRVLHFLLWMVIDNNAIGYTVFIALTQVFTGWIVSKLIVRLGYSEVQAVCVGLVWALSPFSVTSSFHYYSYLILPWQVAIVSAFLLATSSSFLRGRIAAFILLGVIIALTGESHLVGTSILLVIVAFGCSSPSTFKTRVLEACTVIFSTLAAIGTYFILRSLLISSSNSHHRFIFSVPSFDDFSTHSLLFLKSIVLGVSAQINPVFSISGAWILLSFIGAACLGIVLRINLKSISVKKQTKFELPIFITFVFICSLVVIWGVSVLSGQISPILPRRYGYIPYTIGLAAMTALITEPFFCRRLKSISVLLIIVVFWIWMTLQGIALPVIRMEDRVIWEEVTEAIGHIVEL